MRAAARLAPGGRRARLVGLLLTLAAGCTPVPDPGAPPAHATTTPALAAAPVDVMPADAMPADAPLLPMHELMALVLDPAAGVLRAAADPDPLRHPHSTEAWQAVGEAAAQLERGSAVLAEPGWSLLRPPWQQAVAQLRAAVQAGAAAAQARDLPRLAEAGWRLQAACDECHRQYAPAMR